MIQPVRPRDVQRLVDEEGYALIDTRQKWSYDEWHLERAVHIPMVREIQGNSLPKQCRKFGHALFVEFPTQERNFDGAEAWLEVRTIYNMFKKNQVVWKLLLEVKLVALHCGSFKLDTADTNLCQFEFSQPSRGSGFQRLT